MRINSIKLSDFGSHKRTMLQLAARTYLVGHNNAGKSSVIDALTWALTGRCRGLDGTNRDIGELVRDTSSKGLAVDVDVDGLGVVQRATDSRSIFLKIKDWTGSPKQQTEAFYEKTRTNEAVLLACMDSGIFLNLHHADAKALLMSVLDVRITAEELQPYDILGPLSLEELEPRYKRAFDNRTAAKNLLEAAPIYPEPEDDEPPPVEDLENTIADLRQQERDIINEGGEARGRHAELTREIADLRAELAGLESRVAAAGDPHADLDAVEQEIAALPPAAPATTPGDLFPAPAESPASVERDAINVKLVDAGGRLRMLKSSIEGIGAHDPERGCVLNSGVPCLTPAKEFKGKITAAKKEIKDLESQIKDLEYRQSAIQTTIDGERQAATAALSAERNANARRRDLERKRSAATVRASSLQNDQDRVLELTGEIATRETDLANLGDVTAPAGLAELQARIARGVGIVNEAREWHAAKARHLESLEQREDLQAKVVALEALCEALGPKGLIVRALERARHAFEERVNAALGRFGYSLEFQFDPWLVRVNGRKATRLSESERLRVGIALQLAIATISGVNFAAIDRVDMLDQFNRDLLLDVIEAFPGQLILSLTKETRVEPFDPPPNTDDTVFYVLELDSDAITNVRAA